MGKILTFWQDLTKGVAFAVVRNEDAGCVVEEMVEVEKIHGIFHEKRWQSAQRLRYPDGHRLSIVASAAEGHVLASRVCPTV